MCCGNMALMMSETWCGGLRNNHAIEVYFYKYDGKFVLTAFSGLTKWASSFPQRVKPDLGHRKNGMQMPTDLDGSGIRPGSCAKGPYKFFSFPLFFWGRRASREEFD